MTPDAIIAYLTSVFQQTFSFVSSSHRLVYQGDEDGCYYKFSLAPHWSAEVESEVFTALYGEALIIPTPYGPVLKTPNLGVTVDTAWTLEDYVQIAQTLDTVHELHLPSVPPMNTRRYHDMLKVRIHSNPELSTTAKAWLTSNMYSAMENLSELQGTTLVHSDAHKQNWVVNGKGCLSLIDWESAQLACPEVDYASVIHSAMVSNDVLPDCSRFSIDKSRLRNALTLKTMSACCFWAWKHGEVALRERVQLLADTIIPAYDLPLRARDMLEESRQ